MAFCGHCGKELAEGEVCSCTLSKENVVPVPSQPVQTPQAYSRPTYTAPSYNNSVQIPHGYEPISMWGYFGYQLLFAIPCIGFIMLLIFAFGGTQNINLRNYARSYFCFLIVIMVLTLILGVMTGGLAAIAGFSSY